jgi:hypothetical protein
MRFNIFRNPHVDAQVGMLLGSFDQSIRNQSEDYWRKEIAKENSYEIKAQYAKGYLDGYTDAEKHYTNRCINCGTGGISSPWLCIPCKEQNPDWNGEQ